MDQQNQKVDHEKVREFMSKLPQVQNYTEETKQFFRDKRQEIARRIMLK